MNRNCMGVLVVLGLLLAPGPLAASQADYYFYKAGAGFEAESKLPWISLTRGYYLNPATDTQVMSEGKRTMFNTIRDGMSAFSRTLGGGSFDPNRFYFGYELTGAFVDDELIDSQIDLSVIGKMHYWFGDESVYYTGVGAGFAYNQLRDEARKTRDELAIGGHLFFASELEVGRRLTIGGKPCYLSFTFAHRSNGGLEDDNTSLNPLYLSIAGKF